MLVAFRLAKAGYYGGDPEAVLRARADTVLSLVQYEIFLNEYQEEEYLLNHSET